MVAFIMWLLALGCIALVVKYVYCDADWVLLHSKLDTAYFQNKTVWITGCSSGIGRRLAHHLSKPQFNVKSIIISARSKSLLLELRNEIKQFSNRNLQIIVSDFDLNESDPVQYANIYQELMQKVKSIDILINNAGFSMKAYANDMNIKNDISMFQVNLVSAVILLKLVLSDMIKAGSGGHVVCISSIHARLAPCCRTTYSATKSGLLSYHLSLAEEVKHHNISVSVISPGPVTTNVGRKMVHKDTRHKFGNITCSSDMADERRKEDEWINTGMDIDRCTELILCAISNQLLESWPCTQPSLFAMHISYYLPWLYTKYYNPHFVSPKLKRHAGY